MILQDLRYLQEESTRQKSSFMATLNEKEVEMENLKAEMMSVNKLASNASGLDQTTSDLEQRVSDRSRSLLWYRLLPSFLFAGQDADRVTAAEADLLGEDDLGEELVGAKDGEDGGKTSRLLWPSNPPPKFHVVGSANGLQFLSRTTVKCCKL